MGIGNCSTAMNPIKNRLYSSDDRKLFYGYESDNSMNENDDNQLYSSNNGVIFDE